MFARSIVEGIKFWQWAAVIGAILMICMPLAPAHAAIQEIHVIAAGVDSSPDKATEIALDYARKRAVYMLMLKMKIDHADARAAALTDSQLGRIVRGASITQTKRDGDITYADVTVSVVDSVLTQELALDMPPDSSDSTAPMRGVLVLPVYVVKGHPYVWEKENVLHTAMGSQVLRLSHGSVVVPTGDFDDLRLINYRNALTVKAADLKPMFERYGVEEIIIAVITQEEPDSQEPDVILLRRITAEEIHPEQITLPPAPPNETPDDRLQEAVNAVATAATQIAASTSKQQLEKLKNAPHLPIYFKYGSVREVAQMEAAIRRTDGVLQLAIPTIDLNNMQGVLYLSADKDVVKKALTKAGILVADQKNGWLVSLR